MTVFDFGGGLPPDQFDFGAGTPDWIADAEEGANFSGRLTPWQEAGMTYAQWAQYVGQQRAYEGLVQALQLQKLMRPDTTGQTGFAQVGESRRQFDLQFPEQRRQFELNYAQDEAKLGWQQAVDARDFAAAEVWKNRYYQLDQAKFGQQQYTDEASIAQNQNRGAFDYINLLSQMRGPRDYGQYWYTSRGMT